MEAADAIEKYPAGEAAAAAAVRVRGGCVQVRQLLRARERHTPTLPSTLLDRWQESEVGPSVGRSRPGRRMEEACKTREIGLVGRKDDDN